MDESRNERMVEVRPRRQAWMSVVQVVVIIIIIGWWKEKDRATIITRREQPQEKFTTRARLIDRTRQNEG